MRAIKEIPLIILKRFAIAQAKSCLANYEKEYPNDKRVSDCIQAVEDYLDGKITLNVLNVSLSAAWSAAWCAAESVRGAAWSAAWSGVRSGEIDFSKLADESVTEIRKEKLWIQHS